MLYCHQTLLHIFLPSWTHPRQTGYQSTMFLTLHKSVKRCVRSMYQSFKVPTKPCYFQMLYASTRFSLLKFLGSTLFTDSIFATSKDDLTAEAYASHLRHSAAPNPLSKREQELADLRATESQTAIYESSRVRATHIGSGVGLNWSGEVEKAVVDLGGATGSSLVVIVCPNFELRNHSLYPNTPLTDNRPQDRNANITLLWRHRSWLPEDFTSFF